MNRLACSRRRANARSVAFVVGDFAFLVAVSVMATFVMHLVHYTDWPFAICMFVGMLAAMVVQMVMAVCVTPLLGSIEAMVPSMAIAMIAPMSVCLLHLVGRGPMGMQSAWLGLLFGVGMFVFVQVYGAVCRRRRVRFD